MTDQPNTAETDASTTRDLFTLFKWSLGRGPFTASDAKTVQRPWNVRYARELIGVLVRMDLISETSDVDGDAFEADHWDTLEDAEAAFRSVFPHLPARKDPGTVSRNGRPPAESPAGLRKGRLCACGCGEHPSGGAYRPGHDARHVSKVVKEMVTATGSGRKAEQAQALATLPTEALRAKAQASYDRKAAKAAKIQNSAK